MGFGSYSESDQERQEINFSEIEIQEDSRGGFEGDMAFETGTNTNALLAKLSEIKREKGHGVITQTVDVRGQAREQPGCGSVDPWRLEPADLAVWAEEGATVQRTPNGISIKVSMPTPQPGEYCYPSRSLTATPEPGPPETFTLWGFITQPGRDLFVPPSTPDDPDPGPMPWTAAYFLAGKMVSGPKVTLSAQISTETKPVAGGVLEDPEGVDVHLAVVPHGASNPELRPAQITMPAGDPTIWWLAHFDPPTE